jgi:hypothetical protein
MNKKLALIIALICTQLLVCTIPVAMVQATDKNAEKLAVDRFPKLDVILADYLDEQKVNTEKSYAPLSTVVVTVKIIWDDNLWAYYDSLVGHHANPYTEVTPWVASILEDGDDPFESTFDIDYHASLFAYWQSTESGDMFQLFDEGRANFGASGCDVRVFMTGQYCGGVCGLSEYPGNAFIMTVNTDAIPWANLWQHEASHNYGAPDHIPGYYDYCIMSYYWAPSIRDWCNGCGTIINNNRLQFAP